MRFSSSCISFCLSSSAVKTCSFLASLRLYCIMISSKMEFFSSYSNVTNGDDPPHSTGVGSSYVTFTICFLPSYRRSSVDFSFSMMSSLSLAVSTFLFTVMFMVVIPLLFQFATYVRFETMYAAMHQTTMLMTNHTSMCSLMTESTNPDIHSVSTTVHSPVIRSRKSNASTPANIVCKTFKDLTASPFDICRAHNCFVFFSSSMLIWTVLFCDSTTTLSRSKSRFRWDAAKFFFMSFTRRTS
mmetsp:Transcript_13783/g.29596  ORF Transcript_13783/g.29596 Transcript_13783/m.29596 type:complete len:242 (+) Transcript_13783:1587-2312(+)